jgi:tRNA threonylcarbamoyladenosine biosynthesis protein TsaE
VSLVIKSPTEMSEWGQSLGKKLRAGDLILLSGPLGAGKTTLTQGIGLGMGITGITSPTFVISRVHHGSLPLVHVDAYRLQSDPAALFDDLDLESLQATSVIVIEWGEGFIDRISDQYFEIRLAHCDDESERLITVVVHGERWQGFDQ